MGSYTGVVHQNVEFLILRLNLIVQRIDGMIIPNVNLHGLYSSNDIGKLVLNFVTCLVRFSMHLPPKRMWYA